MTPEEAAKQLAQKFLGPTPVPWRDGDRTVGTCNGGIVDTDLLTLLTLGTLAYVEPSTVWAARIVGLDPVYLLARQFIRRRNDGLFPASSFSLSSFIHLGCADTDGYKTSGYFKIVECVPGLLWFRPTSPHSIETIIRDRERYAAPVVPVDVDKLVEDMFG